VSPGVPLTPILVPRVTVVVPARNEARHIEGCVRSILAQRVEGGVEVLVVDGRSTDATAELARRAGAKVVDNPEQITPTALNRGLAVASGRFLLRFDAHSEMSDGYIDACLRALSEESGAVNVGGWCDVRGTGPWGRAIAAALASRFGVGNARLWRRPKDAVQRRDVDTVPFGCFPISALREVGGWRETLVRNQDFELNHRLRAAGGRIVFDPSVWFVYYPRESLRALARQYWDFGRWKAVVVAADPASMRPRQLAPLVLLATASAAVAPLRAAPLARAAILGYAALLTGAAVRSRGGARTVVALATIHFAWGSGLAVGLAGAARRGLGRPRRR
jgi:succinoglycan biosynthesis protein ExoA